MATCIHVGESDALHARARAFVAAFERGAPMPESFDALASDLARFQGKHVAGYARLAAARGVDLASVRRAIDAPAVPTDAFKLARVSAFPEEQTKVTFRTSGTTVGQRGEHHFRTTGTYDRGAVAFAKAALLFELPAPLPVLVVGPPPAEMPDSSLSHMIGLFVATFGLPATVAQTYFVQGEVIDLAAFDERVSRLLAEGREGALVLGTSFAFVHLLDALGEDTFRLPPKSRVMQTGGFKGRSREVDGDVLRRDIARAFDLDEGDVRSEYGMTELSSQFYDRPTPAGRVYVEPPWARVVPVDPETLAPVAEGDVGIARIEDLANVDSAFAIVTADRVRRVEGGFQLLGRLPGAAPRGCSIAIDELLA
jgi:hypothetical protein